jgi:exonuclease SbcC
MIPTSLTIQGLYSYRNRQTIDFTKLVQSGLFGIFGGVGSGKSTILEAISFALFAESERLNKGDDRNYNMMNLQSDELYIDFEFKTGGDNFYKFVVKGKRNSKRFEDVKTFERSAYKKENGQWIPIDEASAETITGLNYNNFHRTIIIPQGRFQDFLQLKPKDRTTMLQELFNLNKFELSGNVARLETRNSEQLQHIQGQLQEVGVANTEDVLVIETNIAAKKEAIKKIAADLQLKTDENIALTKLKDLFSKLNKNKTELTELLKKQVEITSLDASIREYEQFVINFKSDFDNLLSLVKNIENITQELTRAEKEQQHLNTDIQMLTKDYEITKQAFLTKDQLIQEAEALLKLCNINSLLADNKNLEARLIKGKEAVANTIQQIADKKTEVSILTEKVSNHKQNLPDIALLSAIKDWFTINDGLQTSVKEFITKIELLKKEQTDKIKQIDEFSKAIPIKVQPDFTLDIDGLANFIRVAKNNIDIEYRAISDDILHLEIQNKLANFATELVNGKACPLCGSEHHPHILNTSDVTEVLSNRKQTLIQLTENSKKLDVWEKQMSQLFMQIESITAQMKQENNALSEKEIALSKHNELFVWKDFPRDNANFIAEAFKTAGLLKSEIETWESTIKTLSLDIEKAETDKDKFAKALEGFVNQESANNAQIQILKEQVKFLDSKKYQNLGNEQLTEQSKTLINKHKQLVSNYEIQEKKLISLKSTFDILKGSIETNKISYQQRLDEKLELDTRIQLKLQEAGGATFQYVQQILDSKPNVDEARKTINSYNQVLEATKIAITDLENELNGKLYDENIHNEVIQQLEVLNIQQSQYNKEVGRLESELNQLKEKLEKLRQLQADKEKLDLRASDIAELKNLFRGNAFVNYISTVYLNELCNAANERFYMLTKQKLRLELADDNSFLVRDYMNGGKQRSVKTLSGGQVFQASLSLALALADSIHKLSANSENFFFLDEGFGTLDKESLSIVFDTLKALRKENRIVGVISHVEEMQQEIEIYLKVTNEEERGSIIQSSY